MALALHQELVGLTGDAAVEPSLHRGEARGERRVRAGPRRAGDADGQRARGQLVIGQQHERPIDRRPHDRDGVRSPHRGEAYRRARSADRQVVVAEDGRHDPEEPARRGRWIVAGVVHAEGGAHGGDGRHADRPADGPRHLPGPADVDGQRRRPPRLGRQRRRTTAARRPARTSPCGPGRRRRGRGTGAPCSSRAVTPVTICTSSDGRGRLSPAPDTFGQGVDVVDGVQRRATVDRHPPGDQPPADVGVQRRLLHAEQASRLGRADEPGHGCRVVHRSMLI